MFVLCDGESTNRVCPRVFGETLERCKARLYCVPQRAIAHSENHWNPSLRDPTKAGKSLFQERPRDRGFREAMGRVPFTLRVEPLKRNRDLSERSLETVDSVAHR